MIRQNDTLGMLDLMIRPGFCVKNGKIVKVNPAAGRLFLSEGEEIAPMLLTGQEEYAQFTGGCLSLMLEHSGQPFDAVVTAMEDCHVFLLGQPEHQETLRSLALAARELREPLTNVMLSAQRLLPVCGALEDPEMKDQSARLNRGLYQLLRVIGNMSDAGRCAAAAHMETRNISALLEEILEKAQTLVQHAGVSMTFQGLEEAIYCLCDPELLERAVLNILSNAVKFTPAGGSIAVSLTRRDRMLRLTVQDSGSGIAEDVRSTIFSRYLRQPVLEDSRRGIGLGLVLIQAAAHHHGGAVLIDRPGAGTRVTLTLAIRQDPENRLHSPRLRVDYAGEQDHGLIELADCLPPELYRI